MIAKKPPLRRDGGSSIYYLISYICNDDKTAPDLNLKGLWFKNLAGETVREVVVEMRNVVDFGLRKTLNPLVHYVITWPQDETPHLKQIEAYGDYLLKALNLENNQAVMAFHQNTKNDHLHIVANRIGFDGRPVRLAGNGWDVKAAIKAMRELEQMYGLKVQHNGVYDTIDGEIVYTGKQSDVSVRAKDMEAHTGIASQQRKLNLICGKILEEAESWAEAHRGLADFGIILRPKGSGGVLECNGVTMKLSCLGRQYTWGKLIKKFGDYVPGDPLPPPEEIKPENRLFMEKTTPIINTGTWEDYSKERKAYYDERKAYFEARKKSKDDLNDWILGEIQALLDKFKAEELVLEQTPMKFRAKNRARQKLAFRKAKKLDELRWATNTRRRAWAVKWKKHKGGRFPSYKDWLKKENLSQDMVSWINRRHSGTVEPQTLQVDLLFPAEEQVWRLVPGISNFQVARADHAGHVYYDLIRESKEGPASDTAFADFGRLIKIYDESEGAILAAMQLAVVKWGKIKLTGDLQFQYKCFQVALRHGIKVENPDFRLYKASGGRIPEDIEEFRPFKDDWLTFTVVEPRRADPGGAWREEAKKKKDLAVKRIKGDFERYHKALGADKYRITASRIMDEVRSVSWVLDRNKETGQTQGFTPQDVRERVDLLYKLSEQKEHLDFTPLSEKNHHLVIDNVSKANLARLLMDGYDSAVIVEISPDNFQVILNLVKFDENSEVNKDIFYNLSRKLNGTYGELKVSGAVHAHRIPGTTTPSPKLANPDGTYPVTEMVKAEHTFCPKLKAEAEALLKSRERGLEELKQRQPGQEPPPPQTPPGRGWFPEPRRLEGVQALLQSENPISRAENAYTAHIDQMKETMGNNFNMIKADAMAVLRLRATGHSQEAIKEALRVRGHILWEEEGRRRYSNYENYISKIVDRYAFGVAGDEDMVKWNHHLGFWFSVEGRDLEKLAREAKGPVRKLPKIPEWVLATQAEKASRGLAERQLRQAQKYAKPVKPVGTLPGIPEELREIIQTVTLPGGERIIRIQAQTAHMELDEAPGPSGPGIRPGGPVRANG